MDAVTPPAVAAVRDALARATSWREAERNLASLDLHLRPQLFAGGGIYVTDSSDNQWPVSEYWLAGAADLEARFGATFEEHSRRLFSGLSEITGLSYEELSSRELY